MRRDFEGEEAGRKEVQGKSVDEEGAGGAFHSSASGYKVYLCTYRLALFELLGEETRACSSLSGPPLEVHWCCYPFAPQKPFCTAYTASHGYKVFGTLSKADLSSTRGSTSIECILL